MAIYSFLCLSEGRGKYELLGDHISNALEYFKGLKDGLFVKNINSKLLSGKVNFNVLVKHAVFFHDIGKVFYQKTVRDGCLSFKGHEFLSALVYRKYIVKTVEEGVEDYDKETYEAVLWPVTFSILHHHHAMGYTIRMRSVGKLSVDMELVGKIIREDLPELAKQFFPQNKVYIIRDTVENMFKAVSYSPYEILEETYNLGSEVWRILESKPRLKKLSLATLMVLIILDYLSAYKGRRGPRLRFYNILEQHYKILSTLTEKRFSV